MTAMMSLPGRVAERPHRVTSEHLAIAGLALVAIGISFATLTAGPQSSAYFTVIASAMVLCAPAAATRPLSVLAATAALAALPLVAMAANLASGAVVDPNLLAMIGVALVIILSAIAGGLSVAGFQRLMAIIALAHLPLAVFALGQWYERSVPRLGLEGMSTAVLGEIAVGLFLAALLSRRLIVVLLATPVSVAMIIATQMRGAGLAMAVIAIVALYHTLRGRIVAAGWLAIVLAMAVLLVLNWQRLEEWFAASLMLNDYHRGLGSGFSGRIDNWQVGFSRFLEAPLIGVTPADPAAGTTHNGFIRLLAEFGLIVFVPLVIVLLAALWCAWSRGHGLLAAAILGYIVFIGAAPRHLNFQLMPFVAIMAIAAAIQWPARPLGERSQRSATPRTVPDFNRLNRRW